MADYSPDRTNIRKCVILAGGLGSRLAEETALRPKPMVEIGGRPLLWHIMQIYSASGITEFVICLGYKAYMVKEYFNNYFLHTCDVTFDLARQETTIHSRRTEPWRVTLVDTGALTMTGGRIKRIAPYIGDEHFCMTYGDGVSDIDIRDLLSFHAKHSGDATMTVVRPSGRFGAAELDGDCVRAFREKPGGESGWINAGFFVLSPRVFNLIADDQITWEREPLETLASTGQLRAYRHHGFWQPVDTLREKQTLEDLWSRGAAPWVHL